MKTRKSLLHLAVACAFAAAAVSLPLQAAQPVCAVDEPCALQAPAGGQSQFDWLNRINKASLVMLHEQGIVTAKQARLIAGGVRQVIEQGQRADGKRPSDVLQLESLIIERIGPQASLIHSGRSRQDMYATYRLALLRNQMLGYGDRLNALRGQLLTLAGEHVETLVPAYTNGVQAMPTTYAHYLLAFAAAFERDAQRIHELYARLNRSPMGTAVMINSGWPLDRERLSALLGFDGVREHSMDAGQVSTYDIPLEAVAIASSTAIRVAAMIGDIHTQYHQTRPWLLLDESTTYSSSAMPQKRNPGLLMRARESASDVVGLAHATSLRAHNVTTGMTDYKAAFDDLGVLSAADLMLERLHQVLAALVVNPERAREELDADWTTSMELADTLEREHQVPFRIGHGFASRVVGQAREQGVLPGQFPYAEARRLYALAARQYQWSDQLLPLDQARWQAVLSPRSMVDSRQGTGGPQRAEVERMLGEARQQLARDEAWQTARRAHLRTAEHLLDEAFARLSN